MIISRLRRVSQVMALFDSTLLACLSRVKRFSASADEATKPAPACLFGGIYVRALFSTFSN